MERKLHPNIIRYWQIKQIIHTLKWVAGGGAMLVVRSIWLSSWEWLTPVSLLVIALFTIKGLFFIFYGVHIKYARRSYCLGADELMIRWGNVWSDNSTIIPLSRVQHVDQEQDMLAKRLGLSELTITTAGDDHYLIGLAEEEAVRLRREIIDSAKLDRRDVYYD